MRSNNPGLKYQRFTLKGYQDIGIRKFEFDAKTQFHCKIMLKYQKFTLKGCQDIGIGKFEFVAKTQFLCKKMFFNVISSDKL